MGAPRREGDGAARLHGRGAVAGSARGTVVIVAGPGGTPVPVEVDAAVAGALEDMRREAWRIDRREARNTLSLDAMRPSAAIADERMGPEAVLMRRCDSDVLLKALMLLPPIQLRRLLVHAVAQIPVKEIAARERCSERAIKYSLARAKTRMRMLLADDD